MVIISKVKSEEITLFCESLISSGRELTVDDADQRDIDFNVIYSVYNQLLVRRVKSLSHQIDIQEVIERVNVLKESLYSIAMKIGFSPYKLAKMYAEAIYGSNFQITDYNENALRINDPIIYEDILKCYSYDINSSPEISLIRQTVGREFEEVLYKKLTNLQICYETENEMRKKGKSKTPDVLLLIPMAVLNPLDSKYYIVNWIDSKGMFGNEEVIEEHLEQLNGYINRYGQGMVIYWYGFVDIIQQKSDSILICDKFPERWLFPSGETAAAGEMISFDAIPDATVSQRFSLDINS